MKKSLLVMAVVIVFCNGLFSQSIGKGKSVFYVGVGPGTGGIGGGHWRGVGYTYHATPVIHLGFEHGISESIPESVIGLGGALSFQAANYSYRDYNGHGWNSNWSDLRLLVKGYYHHKFLVGEKWDVYAAVMLGFRYRFYSFTANDAYYTNSGITDTGVAPAGGIAVGGRYYVSDRFGFYAELGAGVNVDYAQIGFAFKF